MEQARTDDEPFLPRARNPPVDRRKASARNPDFGTRLAARASHASIVRSTRPCRRRVRTTIRGHRELHLTNHVLYLDSLKLPRGLARVAFFEEDYVLSSDRRDSLSFRCRYERIARIQSSVEEPPTSLR